MGQHANAGQMFVTVMREDVPKPTPPKKGEKASTTPGIATAFSQLRAMIWLSTVRSIP